MQKNLSISHSSLAILPNIFDAKKIHELLQSQCSCGLSVLLSFLRTSYIVSYCLTWSVKPSLAKTILKGFVVSSNRLLAASTQFICIIFLFLCWWFCFSLRSSASRCRPSSRHCYSVRKRSKSRSRSRLDDSRSNPDPVLLSCLDENLF